MSRGYGSSSVEISNTNLIEHFTNHDVNLALHLAGIRLCWGTAYNAVIPMLPLLFTPEALSYGCTHPTQ